MSRKNWQGGDELFLLKISTTDCYAYLPCYCPGPLALWGFSHHLPVKYRRRPKNVLPSERRVLGTMSYGKSGFG